MNTALFDLSNLMYLAAYRVDSELPEEKMIEEMIRQAELYMRQLYRTLNAQQVLFCCDSHHYWRRDIFPEYKGNREDHELKRRVKKALVIYKEKHAKLCVEVLGCEGDDVVRAATQYLPGNKVIVSSDRDFVQLMSGSVSLFDPKSRTYRKKPKNVSFDLFLKCIRGDRIDNISSAFPRVHQSKLLKAFESEKALNKILDTRLATGEKVRELYFKNKELIDLSCIPLKLDQELKRVLESVFESVFESVETAEPC